jgi:hypothetical protein
VSLLSSAIEFALGLAAKALRLTRVDLPPKLEGPRHEYPTGDSSNASIYICIKCRKFNARRAAFTQPPCSERLPSAMELP